jgi:hypothetical protein
MLEEEFIQRAVEGDQSAMSRLLLAHYDQISARCARPPILAPLSMTRNAFPFNPL